METESKSTVILTIINGLGVYGGSQIINKANTPNLHHFINTYPATSLYASGKTIGLKEGEKGNSKVGNTVMGCGRSYSDLNKKIENDIKSNNFLNNEVLEEINSENNIHLVGEIRENNDLDFEVCVKLLEFAEKNNFSTAFHLFIDKGTSKVTVKQFINKIKQESSKNTKVASIIKKDLSVIRNKNWEEIKRVYDGVVDSIAPAEFEKPNEIVKRSNSVIASCEEEIKIKNNDNVIFFNSTFYKLFNFSKSLSLPVFKHFERNKKENLNCISINSFEKNTPISSFYSTNILHNGLTETISKHDLHQLHISDTSKFAFLNFYFNGNISELFKNEQRELVSTSETSFSKSNLKQPTQKVYKTILERLHQDKYDFISASFPKFELTSNKKQKLKALSFIDKRIGKIAENVLVRGGALLIVSDYQQELESVDKQEGIVPCVLVDSDYKGLAFPSGDPPESNLALANPAGSLKDVAPTILDLMSIRKSDPMTGNSLLKIR